METATSDDRDAMTAIDDGCTEPLHGVLCDSCCAVNAAADPDAHAAAQEQAEADRIDAEEAEVADREAERDGTPAPRS